MGSQSSGKPESHLYAFISSAPALIGGFSSLCYVLGLLVTNMYLASFGVYFVEFFRGEYLLTGAVLVFLVSITWASLQYAINSTRVRYVLDKRASRNLRLAVRVLVMAATFLLLENAVFKIVAASQFVSMSGEWWVGVLILSLFSGCFELLRRDLGEHRSIEGAGKIYLPSMRPWVDVDNKLVEFIRGTPLILPGLLLSVMLGILQVYSEQIYPHLRGSYGGGAKNSVYMMPTPRGVEISKTFSFPFSKDQKLIGPLEMLTESDNEMIVLINNELISGKKVAVRLAKKDFDATQTRPAE